HLPAYLVFLGLARISVRQGRRPGLARGLDGQDHGRIWCAGQVPSPVGREGTSPTMTTNRFRSAGYTVTVSRNRPPFWSKPVRKISNTWPRPSAGSRKNAISSRFGARTAIESR